MSDAAMIAGRAPVGIEVEAAKTISGVRAASPVSNPSATAVIEARHFHR